MFDVMQRGQLLWPGFSLRSQDGNTGTEGRGSHDINSGFPQVLETGLLKMENAYQFPNLRCRARVCRTNLPSNTALRGFGFPQTGLITESCITKVAAKCGLSPEKVTVN